MKECKKTNLHPLCIFGSLFAFFGSLFALFHYYLVSLPLDAETFFPSINNSMNPITNPVETATVVKRSPISLQCSCWVPTMPSRINDGGSVGYDLSLSHLLFSGFSLHVRGQFVLSIKRPGAFKGISIKRFKRPLLVGRSFTLSHVWLTRAIQM